MMHLPAVTITLTLLSLYIAKIRWDNPSSESLNALQFAAKVHEAALLMSLGDILLYRISCGLNRQDVGVPLGFLSSAFYLSAPLRYLVSRQLWVPTLRSGNSAKYRWITCAIIVLVSILCMGASPLSAIALIPRLNWWKDNMFNPFGKEDTDYHRPVTKWVTPVKYRTRFDGKSGPFISNITNPWTKPWDRLVNAGVVEGGPKTEFTNCTYSNYEELDSLITLKYESGIASGTRPLSFVTLGLLNASMNDFGGSSGIRWLTASHQQALDSGTGVAWKQPLVTVECSFSSPIVDYTAGYFFQSLNESVRLSVNSLINRTAVDYQLPNLRNSHRLPISADILFRTTEDWGAEFTLCVILAS
ncbi:hypothetical protein FAGAP_5600 [Fusarium agapanthi]|uniref:Transmembrane protein n=1 Tax=Fusarium agapanthi TaxID=1803897 RepID=A0A9P5BB58_9HYPO|nr:hypothetical protein FAGAP_5600 [Fusarium agapanthi]